MWRAQTFAYLAYHLSWFLFGFYLLGVLVLVVIFMTSQGLPKTDFVRKTCCVFGIGGFSNCSLKRYQILPHLVLSSFVEQWCFSAYSSSGRCGDSNEPKNIENGVRMQKLWQFSFCCFCCLGGIGYSGSNLNRKFRFLPDWQKQQYENCNNFLIRTPFLMILGSLESQWRALQDRAENIIVHHVRRKPK